MNESLRATLASGAAAWTGLGLAGRLALVALAVLVPALLLVGVPWLTQAGDVPLFAGLGAEETQAIIAQLQASRTPYRLVGEQLMVPADKAAEIRLKLASQGVPIGAGVGFEVFDRTALGVSDFQQRLNYQRALQGELARTIAQLQGVARARVHLVLPQASLFAEREKPASASVFLKLAPGARLSSERVRGIVHLVASSVEGLAPERVTVIDTAGRVLLTAADAGAAAGLSPRRLELKAAVEEGVERRVQTLLDAVLGPGQAAIRVSAQINLDQKERTEERFDPNPVIRQETRTVESAKGSSASPLVVPPPAAAGAAAPAPPASTTSNDGTRESESVSYELSKVVARTLTTPGEVQRLSVAVLLNARPAAPREGGEARPGGRPPEEVEKIRRVVMGAVGFDASRGDEVTVVEMPFESPVSDKDRADLDAAPGAEPGLRVQPGPLAIGAAAVVVVMALLGVVLMQRRARALALAAVARTLDTAATAGASRPPAATGAATTGAAAPDDEEEGRVPEEFLRLGKERKGLRQRAVALASAEPEATAQLLRAWMVKKRA